MGCKVVREEKLEGIPVSEMKCGELGEVVLWYCSRAISPVGQIVQRYKDIIIVVGECGDDAYPDVLSSESPEQHRVRLLNPLETIQIE